MSLPNEKYREVLFLLLYSYTLADIDRDETAAMIMEQLKVPRSTLKKGELELEEILKHLNALDEKIKSVATSYDFERIQSIEKTALRLGVFEMFFGKKIPPKVAIAEALRLSKKFSTTAAVSFVNALLDALYKASMGEIIDSKALKSKLEHLSEDSLGS